MQLLKRGRRLFSCVVIGVDEKIEITVKPAVYALHDAPIYLASDPLASGLQVLLCAPSATLRNLWNSPFTY